MDDVLLLVSRLALGAAGAGGAVAFLFAAARRTVAWVPAIAGAIVQLGFVAGVLRTNDDPLWVLGLASLPWFLGFPLFAATFPDGRPTPRWALLVVCAALGVEAVDAMTGFTLRERAWWSVAPILFFSLCLFCLGWRYRHSATTQEREQLRWILLGVVISVAGFQLLQVARGVIGGPDAIDVALANAAGIPLILGLAVAAARPRIGNVDVTFRAVLIALLSGWALFGVYALSAAVVTSGGGSPVVSARWAAAAMALAAYPVVRIAVRIATWLVFRDRLTPQAALSRLGAELDADDHRSIAQRIVDVAATATGAAGVRLRSAVIADADAFDAATGVIVPDVTSAATRPAFPVTFRGEHLATLVALPRPGESELSMRDRRVLAAVAQHSAPALDGARALRTATRAQTELLTAHEEERRRLRRDLHDDLGPALAGVALQAAAIAHRAATVDPSIAADARELHADIQDAAARARDISHGLRPAVLDDRGLAAAIRDRVGALSGGSDGIGTVEFDIADLGPLPAAVDLAALRIVQEAVANVRRHAAAEVCRVSLTREANGIRIDVRDDGVGIPATTTTGLGIRSIRERAAELGGRARIDAGAHGGTIVRVWLPAPDPHMTAAPASARQEATS